MGVFLLLYYFFFFVILLALFLQFCVSLMYNGCKNKSLIALCLLLLNKLHSLALFCFLIPRHQRRYTTALQRRKIDLVLYFLHYFLFLYFSKYFILYGVYFNLSFCASSTELSHFNNLISAIEIWDINFVIQVAPSSVLHIVNFYEMESTIFQLLRTVF